MWMCVPQPVQGPAILGPDGRAGVPELGLEELAARVDEAAAVRGDGAVVAGQWPVDGAARGAGEEGWRGVRRGGMRGSVPAAQRDLGEEAGREGGEGREVDHGWRRCCCGYSGGCVQDGARGR
jgi:hypothetical protein